MNKLIGKGKHTVNVGNNPHRKLVGRLKDKVVKSSISTISNLGIHKTIRCKMISKTVIVRGGEYTCMLQCI